MGERETPGSPVGRGCEVRQLGEPDLLDLRDLKAEARRLLPRGHPIREALQGEPDLLPAEEGRAKLASYARILARFREGERG